MELKIKELECKVKELEGMSNFALSELVKQIALTRALITHFEVLGDVDTEAIEILAEELREEIASDIVEKSEENNEKTENAELDDFAYFGDANEHYLWD